MTVTMSDLVRGESVTTVIIGSQELEIWFDPNKYTPKAEVEWRSSSVTGLDGMVLATMLADLLVRWTLKGEFDEVNRTFSDSEDKMYPTSLAALAILPADFLRLVVDKVMEEIREGNFRSSSS